MRRLGMTCFGLAALVTAAATPAVAQDGTTSTVAVTKAASTDTVEVQPSIPYYEGGPTLDAYLPKDGRTGRPALILVHGGGWNSGSGAEFAPYAMQAANEQGWAVFDVNYLLAPTDPSSWPDELHDIQAAIRFVAANEQRFGIDPQKVVAIGESAGANLLAIVSSEGTANPLMGEPVGGGPTLAVPLRAVGLWSPPVDMASLYSNAGRPPSSCGPDKACDFIWTQGAIEEYFRCDPTTCPRSYADASPITWVSEKTSPSFIVNSSDELVPVAQVQQYVSALQADKVDVEFVELPGTLHAIQYGHQIWGRTMSFLGQQLDRASGPSTTSPVARLEEDEGDAWRLLAIGGAILVVAVSTVVVARRRQRRDASVNG